MKPVPRELLRCPVHQIPDCSPLLNGCSIPNRLADVWAAGYRAGLADSINAGSSAIHGLADAGPLPVDSMPSSYVISRICRCGQTRLDRETLSCPACSDHIDLPVVAER